MYVCMQLSRPLLTAEVARINRYALDFALARNLVDFGQLPYDVGLWKIGRPSMRGQDVKHIEQIADIVPLRDTCETSKPVIRSFSFIRDFDEDPVSGITGDALNPKP
jgi:hypothetical protein